MANTITIDAWLDVIDREYLSSLISDGGATVKFAIAGDDRRRTLEGTLEHRCRERGYVFVKVDAATCRVHMPQDIFFALASELDWPLLARRVTLRFLRDRGFRVDGIDPQHVRDVVGSVAEHSGLELSDVLTELRPVLYGRVHRNPDMVRAFRVAMNHLCLMTRRQGTDGDGEEQPLIDWLTGANTRIGNVRHFEVHTPINRTTARYFIESALYWIRFAGYAGTVILLDNARVLVARNPRDGLRYYTRAMTVDHYEVLREFIDNTDRLQACLLAVATDETFVDENAQKGWGIYSALRTRVMDDVRDRNVVNPVAALVRLS
ncbi:MAG: DUF2791 family P-loop domain-containing protein [bacterium]|nr:DUF2791 family P-loop domain-containing protein [bacterium]MDE0242670.1 DUF2791 family P-loop domain-containing protein [bacterium]